ncbi:MAG TPA: YqeG family HAD IIIA-type phosphatase [Bacillota bacterium]|nr:YqeG family HAD IIIA-type phosphatase [Bacillota bacterium]HOR85628.1 YqeG family HAD IIIA-type phosphatase [Bacillota bacterium]HPL52758.1 YqeG family HAD IIIA-type phosphatase [Bacillota bacterium]
MKKRLKPDLYLNTVHELDTAALKTKGIRAMIVDIDNTLVSWDTKEPDEKINELICRLGSEGFKICILSNNSKKRVEEFNRHLNLPAIHKAVKPSKTAFRKAMNIMDSNPENTAVIGDQLFTDVLGGNRLGLYTVLVPPICKKEFIWTRFMRLIERIVLNKVL